MSLRLPHVAGHPNRIPFAGCLTFVDTVSRKSPSGGRGHRMILTREAAEHALPSLLGMAISYRTGWDGHDARNKVGIITGATLRERQLRVRGFVFAKDFPEVIERQRTRDDLGMSFELADAHVENMRASIWTVKKATFTGAAVLARDKAAFAGTTFRVWLGSQKRGKQERLGGDLPAVIPARFVCASQEFYGQERGREFCDAD